MVNVQARTILWHLVFWGFAINYISYMNLNITIIQMIAAKDEPKPTISELSLPSDRTTTASIPELSIGHNNISSTLDLNNETEKAFSTNNTNLNPASDGFHWNEYEQGLILGSFYWLHWLTQLPGGMLAKKYGTKLVFGLSNVIGCWLCFFIPMAANCSVRALIILRIIQGIIVGLTWPAMQDLTAKWIPPNERSKFVTAYFGCSVGVALAYPLFAYIMHWSSWEWVYHICGIFGTIWWFGWLLLVYDSPAQHPRISETELKYIEGELGKSVKASPTRGTPWKAILTSRPVWMNVIGQWGGVWGLFTIMTQSPTYFKVIHNWDLRATGILSGLPHIMRMSFAYFFSLYADYLLRTNKLSRTNLRKLATAICVILNGLFVLALAYLGRNPILAITFITLGTMFQGAGSSGPLASMIDISPNYVGITSGISFTIGCLPAFLSTYIVGILTLNNQTFEAWTNVFLICAGMLIGCGIIYVCFADSTLQKWNSYSAQDDNANLQELQKEEEEMPLNTMNLSVMKS